MTTPARRASRYSLVALMALAALALPPSLAQGNLAGGDPEFTSNAVLLGATHAPILFAGTITIKSPQLGAAGSELECANVSFGSAWNEGRPKFGFGQVLEWAGGGHVPVAGHAELSDLCRGTGNFLLSWMTAEAPLTTKSVEGVICKEGKPKLAECPAPAERESRSVLTEATRSATTTPWNVELMGGEREEEEIVVPRVGYPTEAGALRRGFKTEAEEEKEVAAEEQNKAGCYKEAPVRGCVQINVVDIFGAEDRFQGTLRPKMQNGFGNGLNPSKWQFEGRVASGRLRLIGEPKTEAVLTGQVLISGFNDYELIQGK